ncbi:ornithine aminotransferase [Niastella koreensis]|uniref:Transport-associated protein n=2 Tax=Niastella koreensis TaxID=354356 RepID=G8TJ89_NIAKG|nr:BON domain-containing protein [Niastella koreensis]AEV98622.1 transport-associated protein [Niastella koreensis GR20-10]OQP53320.1 ornithine aminotransferase [Niastella koreensis]
MKTDREILNDVQDELKWDPYLSTSEIGVSVKNGIVTLTGVVDSYWKKLAAENTVKKVSGVTAVVQKIEVNLSESGKRKDTEIAEAIQNAFKWSVLIPKDKIKVKVENGWVTLEGDVEWEFQKNSARKAVEKLEGVMGVSNNIRVAPKASPADIKQKIKSAFLRSATFDSDRIQIDVDGSTVTLRGKVRSWAEMKEAEREAWLAPGVMKVKNEIEIDTEVFA